ncbi:MAG: gliding motility-associated C-terminal domain-containing protein [Ginsengibacter sp.]
MQYMFQKFVSILFLALLAFMQGNSQTCTALGQNPSTAFPVCGTDTFSQTTVPYCGGKLMPGICSADGVTDINPFWYKFTCFKAGTLGFLITPNDLNDDYDWELFDITGRSPGDIYTNTSLFTACNWSGNTGLTGASAAGTSLQNCAGPGYPTFSSMPSLKLGHNYLLLLSHFTAFIPSQNGYKLSFGGGTASITDTLSPDIFHANASCDATQIFIKLNKRMKCSSLATDGSDFSISPAVTGISGTTGIGCNSGFDMDSVMLTLNSPLPPGNYSITIKNGSDGNTLLDYCDRNIDPGRNLPLVISPLKPVPMDSLSAVGCAPQSLQLVFAKNIKCNSVAANGSDFIVTGPSPVTVISAQGNCDNGVSKVINVILSGAIVSQGNYQIKLAKGSDGNTVIDECGQETLAGSILNFLVKDTVSADFTYTIAESCAMDTIAFSHEGGNGVYRWFWQLGDAGTSMLRSPLAYFTTFGTKQIVLAVSNGVCSDTTTKTINLDNELKAVFETNNLLCPEDAATFINNSLGNISNYFWDFGVGSNSISKIPSPLHYPIESAEKIYTVRLVVENTAGCFDTAYSNIKVLKSCYIAVPNAFTPNGDGLNDYLYPLNAYKADNLEFSVYNRVGELVFHTNDWTQKWNGTLKGDPQDSGVYVWMLKYTNHDTGKKFFLKGSTLLIR